MESEPTIGGHTDDIVLMATTRDDMQKKIDDLAAKESGYGLRVNAKKTKCMNVRDNPTTMFKLNIANIEYVNVFTYLGSNISPDGGINEDVGARII